MKNGYQILSIEIYISIYFLPNELTINCKWNDADVFVVNIISIDEVNLSRTINNSVCRILPNEI